MTWIKRICAPSGMGSRIGGVESWSSDLNIGNRTVARRYLDVKSLVRERDIVGWTNDDALRRPRRRDPERVAARLSKCRCEPDRDYGTGDANCALYRAERRRPPRTVPT